MSPINSRSKSSLKTIYANLILQFLTIGFEFVNKSVFVYKLGDTYLGIDGLFKNVISLLNLSEMGVGTAITFYMFKPAVENNYNRLQSLVKLYKKAYELIGVVILGLGLLVMLFFRWLLNFEVPPSENIYLIYILYLVNTVLSYFLFAYCLSVFTANQEMHIVGWIRIYVKIVSSVIGIGLLWMTGNFIAYLIIQIVSTVTTNVLFGVISKKRFPYVIYQDAEPLSKKEITMILANTGSIFIFELGSRLLTASDNFIISAICGTGVVGIVSNYYLIVNSVEKVHRLTFQAIQPSIGNLNASDDDEKQLRIMDNLNFVNYWIVTFFSISIMILLQPFITIWMNYVGDNRYILDDNIPFIMGMNFWIHCYMEVVAKFRETKGLFRHGMLSQLFTGLTNIVISIIFGKIWGVTGILFASTISMFFVGMLPFPYFVLHYGYNKPALPFISRCLGHFVLMIFLFLITKICCSWIVTMNISMFIARVIVCCIVPNAIIYLIFRNTDAITFVRITVSRVIGSLYK